MSDPIRAKAKKEAAEIVRKWIQGGDTKEEAVNRIASSLEALMRESMDRGLIADRFKQDKDDLIQRAVAQAKRISSLEKENDELRDRLGFIKRTP